MWYFLLDFQLRLCLAKCAWQLLMLQHHSTTWMDEWQVNRSGKSSPGDPSVWSQHPMCQHSVGHTLGPWNAGLVSTGPRSMGERQNSKLPLSCTTFFWKKCLMRLQKWKGHQSRLQKSAGLALLMVPPSQQFYTTLNTIGRINHMRQWAWMVLRAAINSPSAAGVFQSAASTP